MPQSWLSSCHLRCCAPLPLVGRGWGWGSCWPREWLRQYCAAISKRRCSRNAERDSPATRATRCVACRRPSAFQRAASRRVRQSACPRAMRNRRCRFQWVLDGGNAGRAASANATRSRAFVRHRSAHAATCAPVRESVS